jgi:hypothetical protein
MLKVYKYNIYLEYIMDTQGTIKTYAKRQLLDNDNLIMENDIVIAQDLQEGKKFVNFRKFNLHNDEKEILENLLEKDNHFYEVIYPQQPVKPYFDLEMEPCIETDHKNLLLVLVNIVIKYVLDNYKIQLVIDDFEVLDSCRENKLSYHMLIQNKIYFKTVALQKVFILDLFQHIQNTEPTIVWGDKSEKTIMDKLVYGKAQNFRCVNQSKKGKKFVLRRTSNVSVMDCFVGLYWGTGDRIPIEPEIQEIKNEPNSSIPKKKTDIPKIIEKNISIDIPTIIENDKYLELLFTVIKNELNEKGNKKIAREDWFQIFSILYTNDYPIEYWVYYSGLISKTKTAEDLWKRFKPLYKMDLFGLQTIAKFYNYQGYKEWLVKHTEYLSLQTLAKGENDIAKFISPFLIKSLVFCRKEWWGYNKTTHLWDCLEDPSAMITTFIQRKMDEGLECLLFILNKTTDEEEYKKLSALKNEYPKHYKNVCKSGVNSQIIKYLKTYLNDSEFFEKLDKTFYRIAFKNGILDLKTLEFKKGITEKDYISKTIPFDYEVPKDEDVKWVRENIKKICNYNERHLEYYLSALGYVFTGDTKREQKFWYYRGQTAENGKSVIFEALEIIAPNYVIKANKDTLDKGADLRKEINTWRGLLLLWLDEVSQVKKDEDLLKAICNGTGYKYNQLYNKSSVVMPINFKLMAVSNNTLNIKADAGIKRRFTHGQMNAQFPEDQLEDNYETLMFIKDKDFGDKLTKKYRNALLYLIFTYSKYYFIDQKLKDYPIEWKEEATEIMNSNNQFEEWFKDIFQIGENQMIHKDEFNSIMENSKYKTVNVKDEIARMKLGIDYKSQHSQPLKEGSRKQGKGWWFGFSLKIDEEEPECLIDTKLT